MQRIYAEIAKEAPLIHQELFEHTNNNLAKAINAVYGKDKYGTPGYELAQHFKRNAARFSAYKSLQLTQLLANAKETEILAIEKKYNTDYQRAEYGHFTRSAQGAKNWERYEDDKEVYPFLEFIPSVSANPRDSHKIFYGVIRPIDDVFWDTHLPPIEWECKCSVQQRRSDNGSTNPDLSDVKVVKAIEGNPYKTKQIITDKHPIIAITKKNKPDLVPTLQKWEAAGFANRKFSEITKFKSVGKGCVVEFGDYKHNTDYQRVQVAAKAFAEQGAMVEITPNVHHNNEEYIRFYPNSKNSIYNEKKPDLRVNGLMVEHEGFTTLNPKKALKNMLSHGSKQADRLVIEDCGHNDWYYKKRVVDFNTDKTNKHKIKQLWILRENGSATLIK